MAITLTISGQYAYEISWECAKSWIVLWNFLEEQDPTGKYDIPVTITRTNGDEVIFSEKALRLIGEILGGTMEIFTKSNITEEDCKNFDKMLLEEKYCSTSDFCDVLLFVNFMGNEHIINRMCYIIAHWIRGKSSDEIISFFGK